MNSDHSVKDELNSTTSGHTWTAEKIKDELNVLMSNSSNVFNHDFRYDFEDKFHFIYDDETTLFIFDQRLEIRCDKEDTLSANQTFEYEVNCASDVAGAYEKFKSILLENEKG
mgnify:FL=1